MAEYRPDRLPTEFPFPAQLFAEEEEEKSVISPFTVVNFVLRNARYLLLIPAVVFAIVVLLSLRTEPEYTAESTFLPARAEGGSSGGIAAELKGIIGGGRGGNSELLFYSSLVESSALLRKAAASEYEVTIENEEGEPVRRRGTVAQLHGMNPSTPKQDLNASLGLITGMVGSRMETGTGFVVVETQAPWPELAVAINNRVLDLVNDFNVEQRQTQAKAERRFVEQRLAEAKKALQDAEADLMAFIGSNQQFQQLSRAGIQLRQLEREVTLRQGLYTTLAQGYEQARIGEIRNTPVVTVIEHPEDTVHAERASSAIRRGLFAFFLTAFLMLGVVLLKAYLARQSRENPAEYAELMRRIGRALPSRLRDRLPHRAAPPAEPAAVAAGGVEEADRAW